MTKIAYIVGSIAKGSINRQLAEALKRLAPEGVELVEAPIADLPFFNVDLEDDFPAVAREFKDAIEGADGLIIVTPEYSRSIPGVLKNALDWAARPWGQSSLSGKPVGVIGASIGAVGSGIAQQHLRTIIGHMDAITMGQPEAFIHITPGLINEHHEVTNDETAGFLRSYLDAFTAFVARVKA